MSEDGRPIVIVPADDGVAYVVIPPGAEVTEEEVREVLVRSGVVPDVSPDVISNVLLGPRGVPIKVAVNHVREVPPVAAVRAFVPHFPMMHGKPEKSIVVGPDFRERWARLVGPKMVRAGDALGFVRLPGRETTPVEPGSPAALLLGENTRLGRDGTTIVAAKPGIPYVGDQGVGVLSEVNILGDVGSDTGDLECAADVWVEGDIHQGFRVTSWGSVRIQGTLAGSVNAAGSIAVLGGINSPGGSIEASGTVSARFCQNSVVRARGDVIIREAILHSTIEAEGKVVVTGDRGRIVGGLIRAGRGVRAHTVGAPMGTVTVIEVGVSPRTRREHARLELELDRVQRELARVELLIPKSSKWALTKQYDDLRYNRVRSILKTRLRELTDSLYSLRESMKAGNEGFFWAEEVHPGTKLRVGMDEYEFKSSSQPVKFGVMGDETA